MRVIILGSGTSAGVPTLGCNCAVCQSGDPRNKRMRASAYLESGDSKLLIDCGPDFRTQAMQNGIRDVRTVLLTHTHADHVNGLDDLRAYNMIHKHPIEVYGSADSIEDIRSRFAYCFRPPPPGGGIPQLNLKEVQAGQPLRAGGFQVLPVTVYHGEMPILGYRFSRFAYLTDVSSIPDETYTALSGVELLITSALRHRPHPTHMSLDEAVAAAKRIGAKQTWFIHMCHDLEHHATNAILPKGISLSYDGLSLEV